MIFFLCCSSPLPFKSLAQSIKSAFPEHAKKISTRTLPDFLVKAYSLIEKSTRGVLDELGYMPSVTSTKARQRYGWKPRTAEEAAVATAQSLIDLEFIR